jgi:hypothetical protein
VPDIQIELFAGVVKVGLPGTATVVVVVLLVALFFFIQPDIIKINKIKNIHLLISSIF